MSGNEKAFDRMMPSSSDLRETQMPPGPGPDSASRPKRGPVVIVAGAIAPYTHRLYEAFAARSGVELHVLVCVGIEPQRAWQMPVARHYRLKVLRGLRYHRSDLSNIYFNPGVLAELVRIRPHLIMLASFSPTMAMAGFYGMATGTALGVMTDGSMEMDPGRTSTPHWLMRRLFVPRSVVGIGSSESSRALLASYGLPLEQIGLMPIVPPWDAPETLPGYDAREFDVLFCGALEETRKGALFFTDVLIEARRRGRMLKARVTGQGPLRAEMEQRLAAAGISAHFDGFVQPAAMQQVFGSARLFLFPSRGDPWGLVANEAVQCGAPVIGSPHAVSSREFVERFEAGEVVDLDVSRWVEAVLRGLDDRSLWEWRHVARDRAAGWLSLDGAVTALDGAVMSVLDADVAGARAESRTAL